MGSCDVNLLGTLTTAQLAVMTARAADFNRRRFMGVGGTPRPRSPWMRTVNSRLSTVPAPSPQDITISAATGAADICAEDHISGGHGSIVWDYDRRQADLDAWTAANGLTCCPTAVWHAYLDDGGSGFWSDAERGWWPQLDRWEAARRAYNAAVNDYNARVTAYNAAVTAYNAQANAYNTSNTGSRPTFSGTHPGSPPSRHPGPMPRFVNSTVYADYANKDQGPLGCYPALPS